VGAILGPLIANKLGDSSRRWLIIGVAGGFMLVASGWLFFGWAPVLMIAVLAMLIRHMGGSINWTYSTVLLQNRVEDRYLGRVFALDMAIFTLAMAFSVWISGLILDYTDISPRQLSYIFAAGSLWPVVPWLWANSFRRKQLEDRI
jgi:MFS family permease